MENGTHLLKCVTDWRKVVDDELSQRHLAFVPVLAENVLAEAYGAAERRALDLCCKLVRPLSIFSSIWLL